MSGLRESFVAAFFLVHGSKCQHQKEDDDDDDDDDDVDDGDGGDGGDDVTRLL